MAVKFQRDSATGKHMRDSATGKKMMADAGEPCCCAGTPCDCTLCNQPGCEQTLRVTLSSIALDTACIACASNSCIAAARNVKLNGGSAVSSGVLSGTWDLTYTGNCCWYGSEQDAVTYLQYQEGTCVNQSAGNAPTNTLQISASRRTIAGVKGWRISVINRVYDANGSIAYIMLFCGWVSDTTSGDCSATRSVINSLTSYECASVSGSYYCDDIVGVDAYGLHCENCASAYGGTDGSISIVPI